MHEVEREYRDYDDPRIRDVVGSWVALAVSPASGISRTTPAELRECISRGCEHVAPWANEILLAGALLAAGHRPESYAPEPEDWAFRLSPRCPCPQRDGRGFGVCGEHEPDDDLAVFRALVAKAREEDLRELEEHNREGLEHIGFTEVAPGVWRAPGVERSCCEPLALAMIGYAEYPWREAPWCECGGVGGCVVDGEPLN